MIVKSLELKDFMQFEHLDLENIPEDSTIGIFGKNEHGKSTIADAISFSLFGEIPRANIKGHKRDFSRADYVRWGASSCEVELIFKSGKRNFRVYRKINSSGQQDAWIENEDTGERLAHKVRAVNDHIEEEILGFGFKEFRYSSYVAQKEIDLIHQKSSKVKSVINNMLDVDLLEEAYTECYRKFKKIEDDVLPEKRKRKDILKEDLEDFIEDRKDAERQKGELEEIKEKIEEKKEREEELEKEKEELEEIKEIESERKSLKDILSEKEEKREDLKEQLEDAKKAKEDLKELEKRLEDEEERQKIEMEEDLEKLDELIKNKENLKESIETKTENLKQVKKQKEKLDGKEDKLKEFKEFLSKHKDLERRVDSLQVLKDVYENLLDIREGLNEDIDKIDKKIEGYEEKRSEKREDIDDIEEGKVETEINKIDALEEKQAEKEKALGSVKNKRNAFAITTLVSLIGAIGLFLSSILVPGVVLIVVTSISGVLTGKKQKEISGLNEQIGDIGEKISDKKEKKGILIQKKNTYDDIKDDIDDIEEEISSLKEERGDLMFTSEFLENVETKKINDIEKRGKEDLHAEAAEEIQKLMDTDLFDFNEVRFKDIPKLCGEKEKLLDKKKKYAVRVEDLKEDLEQKESLERSIDEKKEELEKLNKKLERVDKNIEKGMDKTGLSKGEDLEGVIDEKLDEIDELKDQRNKLKGQKEELQKKKEKIPELRKELESIREEIQEKKKELEGLPEEKEVDEERLRSVDEELDDIRDELDDLQKQEGELDGEIKTKRGEDEELEEKKEKYEELKSKEEKLERDIQYYKDLRSEFDELQGAIRKEISPQIEQYFSWILPRITENRYKLVKVGDKFEMEVFSEESGDFVELVQLSGGTKDQLLMALRMGFARALTTARSREKQFIFLDEPFSSFDSSRRRSFIDFIKNFEEAFQQMFLISHIEGLEDHVDEYIRIKKDTEGLPYITASWED